jgi:hypothetical protein
MLIELLEKHYKSINLQYFMIKQFLHIALYNARILLRNVLSYLSQFDNLFCTATEGIDSGH